MSELIDRLSSNYVEEAIKTKNNKQLTEFVSNLGQALKKKDNKLYLVRILRKLVPSDTKDPKFKEI